MERIELYSRKIGLVAGKTLVQTLQRENDISDRLLEKDKAYQ